MLFGNIEETRVDKKLRMCDWFKSVCKCFKNVWKPIWLKFKILSIFPLYLLIIL